MTKTNTGFRVALPGSLFWSAVLALGAGLLTTGPAGASMNTTSSQTPGKLVILGASYAKSWGTPPLPGFSVVNRGAGGEQTGGMRARFARDVVALSPDFVLIWGHVNNITQSNLAGAAPDRAEAVISAAREDYLAMVQQARVAGIDVILATEIPLAEPTGLANEAKAFVGRLLGKQSYAERINAHVRELNAFVRQLAAREKLRLLDFEKVFAPDGGARKPAFATEDRSHVSPAGYQALTDYAIRELRRKR